MYCLLGIIYCASYCFASFETDSMFCVNSNFTKSNLDESLFGGVEKCFPFVREAEMGIPGLTPWLMFLHLKYSKCCKVIFMPHFIGHFSEILCYQNLTVRHMNSFFFSVFDFEHRLRLRLFLLLVLRGDGYWGPVGQYLGELELSNLVKWR